MRKTMTDDGGEEDVITTHSIPPECDFIDPLHIPHDMKPDEWVDTWLHGLEASAKVAFHSEEKTLKMRAVSVTGASEDERLRMPGSEMLGYGVELRVDGETMHMGDERTLHPGSTIELIGPSDDDEDNDVISFINTYTVERDMHAHA